MEGSLCAVAWFRHGGGAAVGWLPLAMVVDFTQKMSSWAWAEILTYSGSRFEQFI